ncbi:hypothetical protein CYMTET_3406 [Cymbomonas tetramitiformis]|nr:hypothetical protein CYMTET_3406 [Cymbomonas tetramitiformis]
MAVRTSLKAKACLAIIPSLTADVLKSTFSRKRKRVAFEGDEEEARAARGGHGSLPPLDAVCREHLATLGSGFKTVNEEQLARPLRGELAPEDVVRHPAEANDDLVDFLAWEKTIAADYTFYQFSKFYEHLVRQMQRSTVGISLDGYKRVWCVYKKQHSLQPVQSKRRRGDYKWI